MTRLSPIKMVHFPADRTLADKAKELLKKQNLSQTEVFNLFLKNIVVTGKVDLLSEEELEKQRLFSQLQKEVEESIKEVQAGIYYTDEDLVERYGL